MTVFGFEFSVSALGTVLLNIFFSPGTERGEAEAEYYSTMTKSYSEEETHSGRIALR